VVRLSAGMTGFKTSCKGKQMNYYFNKLVKMSFDDAIRRVTKE
jgi:hypothetical protein